MIKKVRVHFFFRKSSANGKFSIERLFGSIASHIDKNEFTVKFVYCPFSSNGIFKRLALMIWAACNQGDVNHITGDLNFLGLFMKKSKTVLTIHDSLSMYRLYGIKRFIYFLFWIKLPIFRAGVVTFISKSTLRETLLFTSIKKSKFFVIPNCVTVEPSLKNTLFNSQKPNILTVGTAPNKNIHSIIKAVNGIKCKLTLIGYLNDSQKQLLKQCKVDYENCTNLNDSEIADKYFKSDMVVFVPTYEGFGLPILEAQAFSKPLITSRKSPMQDIASKDACLVDPEDIDEIRIAIIRIISNASYRQKLVEAGRKNIKKYSPQIIAMKYQNIYFAMLKDC
jgi:glycosyltransferase involved in cell wall biosynthesis